MEEGGDIGERACLVMQLRDEAGAARNRQRPWFAGGSAAQPHPGFGLARRAQRAHLLAGELVHRLGIGRYLGKLRAQGPGPGLGGRAAGVLFDDLQRRQRMPIAPRPLDRATLAARKAGRPEINLGKVGYRRGGGIRHSGGGQLGGGHIGGLGEDIHRRV